MPKPVQQKPPVQSVNHKSRIQTSNVIDRIKPIGFDDNEGIKITIYGRSGTGKTQLWSTFPKPILAVICSGGFKPGELRTIDTPENRKLIDAVVITRCEELDEIIAYQHSKRKYATTVLDHASGFQDLALKEIRGWDEIPAQRPIIADNKATWGKVADKCKDHLRNLLGLDCHVAIVAQERNFTDDDNEDSVIMPFVGPAMIPSLTGWLNPASDYVCQTFIRQRMVAKTLTIGEGKAAKQKVIMEKVKGEVDFCLRTAPDPVYMSKFRVPKGVSLKLPKVIVDPDFDKIYGLIKDLKRVATK